MSNEKLNFYLSKIEQQYPNKLVLNQGQMLNCINKSRATFSRIIEKNNLHLLPEFTEMKYKRNSSPYTTYEFKIIDIAKFLAKE